MARENLDQLRQLIAQQAARMMVEDGISDFAYAKKKAGRLVGVSEKSVLPANTEIEEEIKLYHQLYNAEDQPQELKTLRKAALTTMQLFERFNPFLIGSVSEGSAGKNAITDIHLFADSAKDVEIFLLSHQIPFESSEKAYRVSDKPSKDKKDKVRKTVPIYTLETEHGLQRLSVFEFDDMRVATKKPSDGSNSKKIGITDLQQLIR
jgi:hypothetical protein